MEVIPAINEVDIREVERKIRLAEGFGAEWAQIDVSDGRFGTAPTGVTPALLASISTKLKYEIHLMTEEPERDIEMWLMEGVRRIIFHLESASNPILLRKLCGEYQVEAGLAVQAATSEEFIYPFLAQFGFWQVLAVLPGKSSQVFEERALQKIKFLREKAPSVIIEVDGGVNLEVAKKVKEAGANLVASASFIFDDPDPAGAYNLLKSI